MHMGYPRDGIISGRYFAEPVPGFGVCVWLTRLTVTPSYTMQAFSTRWQLLGDSLNLYNCYLSFVSSIMTDGRNMPREAYRYIQEIEDILTLKALIEEAITHWRKFDAEYAEHC